MMRDLLKPSTRKAVSRSWHFSTGQNIAASPMSYAANTKQYVAIAAGSDVFSFVLP
jgi:hypothetical protein